jgi:hypothetical protein
MIIKSKKQPVLSSNLNLKSLDLKYTTDLYVFERDFRVKYAFIIVFPLTLS